MSLYWFVSLALVASTFLGQSVTAHYYKPCSNPAVRREWRSMPREERAEWMAAVKVNHPLDMFLEESDTCMCSA